jgi:hypothetical protein
MDLAFRFSCADLNLSAFSKYAFENHAAPGTILPRREVHGFSLRILRNRYGLGFSLLRVRT